MVSVPATITVGSLTLSLQAFIVAAVGMLLGLLMFLVYPHLATAVAGVVTVGVFFLYAYNINCVVVGQCTIFAWVLSSLMVLQALLLIIAVVMKGPEYVEKMNMSDLVQKASPSDVLTNKSALMHTLKKTVKRLSPLKK